MAEQLTGQVQTHQSRFISVLRNISRTMAAVGAAAFGAMMIIVVIDVVGRRFFKHPLTGATELIGILLVIGASWGMGYCQFLQMNIRIDVLFVKFPRMLQAICSAVAYIICATVAGLVAWRAFVKTEEYIVVKIGTTTDILDMPLWPFLAMMATGFALLCFVFLVQLIKSIQQAAKR